jgi:mannitol/fructose-specific phosphotransferase system IIA component (Ntr-type)
MVGLFGLDDDAQQLLVKLLKKRENLGSTGIGNHVAIPHCRSLVVDRLRVAYARKPAGLDFDAIDDKPVNHLFLIVAPPVEISNQYLPVLGKIAQFCKNEQNIARLNDVGSTDEFLAVLKDAEV